MKKLVQKFQDQLISFSLSQPARVHVEFAKETVLQIPKFHRLEHLKIASVDIKPTNSTTDQETWFALLQNLPVSITNLNLEGIEQFNLSKLIQDNPIPFKSLHFVTTLTVCAFNSKDFLTIPIYFPNLEKLYIAYNLHSDIDTNFVPVDIYTLLSSLKRLLCFRVAKLSFNRMLVHTRFQRAFDSVISKDDLQLCNRNEVNKFMKELSIFNEANAVTDDSKPKIKSDSDFGLEHLRIQKQMARTLAKYR
jgi:hypothetical protein